MRILEHVWFTFSNTIFKFESINLWGPLRVVMFGNCFLILNLSANSVLALLKYNILKTTFWCFQLNSNTTTVQNYFENILQTRKIFSEPSKNWIWIQFEYNGIQVLKTIIPKLHPNMIFVSFFLF
jgi:hypothetical protein